LNIKMKVIFQLRFCWTSIILNYGFDEFNVILVQMINLSNFKKILKAIC
jgi:hypothetical protein